MTDREIVRRRLAAQRLSATTFTTPAQVVGWLGAVQAQDYPGAQWGIGQRMRTAGAAALEESMTTGAIIRTHVLRPTWHFVDASDIRWLLALSGPRVYACVASYYRKLGLDDATQRSARRQLTRALAGRDLTRAEIRPIFRRAGLPVDTIRLAFLLMKAELDAAICSGPRVGNQFTYTLLDRRVPPAASRERDESLADLARRYFTSRGPATIRDFAWWSGLTTKDARRAVDIAGRELSENVIEDERYWSAAAAPPPARRTGRAWLLPLYDEFLIAYKDRSASVAPGDAQRIMDIGGFSAPVIIDGRVVAGWKRGAGRDGVSVVVTPFVNLTPEQRAAIEAGARRYARFLGTDVVVRLE